MIKHIQQAADYLKKRGFEARYWHHTGNGPRKINRELGVEAEVSYNHIPYFPTATVEFHKGKLLYGSLEGKR